MTHHDATGRVIATAIDYGVFCPSKFPRHIRRGARPKRIVDGVEEIWCNGCDDFRPTSTFTPLPNGGHHPRCRACRAAERRAWAKARVA